MAAGVDALPTVSSTVCSSDSNETFAKTKKVVVAVAVNGPRR